MRQQAFLLLLLVSFFSVAAMLGIPLIILQHPPPPISPATAAETKVIPTNNYTNTTPELLPDPPILHAPPRDQWASCRVVDCSKDGVCFAPWDAQNARTSESGAPLRVNSSKPCCGDVLYDLLQRTDRAMRALGVEWLVFFGTLLGLARDGELMPWTADVDIVVLAEEHNTRLFSSKNEALPEAEAAFAQEGLYIFYNLIGRACYTENATEVVPHFFPPVSERPHNFWRDGIYIDIYSLDTRASDSRTNDLRYYAVGGPKCLYTLPSIAPPGITYAVRGGQMSVHGPADANAVLKNLYGSDWESNIKETAGHANDRCRGEHYV